MTHHTFLSTTDQEENDTEFLEDDTEFLTHHTFLSATDEEETSAKLKELQNWKEQQVYEEVEDCNQKCVSVRWVISPKIIDGTLSMKARLCAKGFEEDSQHRTDSPTSTKEGLRLIFCVITANMLITNG